MLTAEKTADYVKRWVAAFESKDLDRVLAFYPSLTVTNDTSSLSRIAQGFAADGTNGCVSRPQARLRTGAGGLICNDFKHLAASAGGSVTCQTVPLGLNNCAS